MEPWPAATLSAVSLQTRSWNLASNVFDRPGQHAAARIRYPLLSAGCASIEGHGRHTRLRWQAEHPNALWQGDVCYGPNLVIDNAPRPLRIHGLLDDCSRYVTALEAHHTEQETDMLGLFVNAIRRHGRPDVLYLDNGSTYRGDTLRLACERLGITLLHPQPRDPQARGKIERFWRDVRQNVLDFVGACTSLHDVNVRLLAFLDQHYHTVPHGGLMGKTPAAVYASMSQADRRPAPTETELADALTMRERRRVRRDTTVAIDGIVWELDQGFLAGRVVTVGRCLLDTATPPWVEHEGQRLELHKVDPIRNSHRHRPLRRPPGQEQPTRHVSFDPATALVDRALNRIAAQQKVKP